MKNLGSLITALLLSIVLNPELLSAQSPSYFPGVVIIKFETDEQLNSLKAKTGTDPRQQVREFLNVHGMSRMDPLLNANAQLRIKSKLDPAHQAPVEELSRIYNVRYYSGADPAVLAAKLARMPGIEYAEPKYIRYMQDIPDDPIDNPYMDFHQFDEVWNNDITGSPEVVIAIVDGGVGYTHQELDEKMWINEDEIPASVRSEVNQNGDDMITSGEVLQYLLLNDEDNNGDDEVTLEDALHPNSSLTTGNDTDGNGYEDDLFGWNFWASGGLNGGEVETDNNPIEDGTEHGTHVAGIAAAETNNGQGIYAAGYDVRYMAVKAGGTPNNQTAIGFGFEGIIYAAEAGADIINCSWGGPGFSQAEADIIEFATGLGSLVIAAAGNESMDEVIYPAAFRQVLGVGSVEVNDQLADYTNYGYDLDVLATGSSIRSTVGDSSAIETRSGTSMAAPVVSGLAGLIKSIHPDWSPLRIATQIRATSTSIENNNTLQSVHKLGKGKINALEAVSTEKPGLMVESVEFVNQEGAKLALGEPGVIRVTIVNSGLATGSLVLNIESIDDNNITLGDTNIQFGTINTDESVTASFNLVIQEDYDLDDHPIFRLNFSDNSTRYDDFAILEYQNILFDVMNVNNVRMSLGGDGTIGFTELGDLDSGVGFIPLEPEGSGDNVLFEGGLMMLANDEMFDAVRSTDNEVSRDFQTEQVFRIQPQSTVSDQDGHARFSVADSSSGTFAAIDLETYAYDRPDLGNVVYVKYTVTNTSEFAVIRDMYLGLFNDWDVGFDPSANGSSFNVQDSILYVFDQTEQSEQPLVAAAHLGPISSALGINNAQEGRRDSVIFGLYDGFTDEEKKLALQSGVANTDISNADVSVVTGSGPYTLDPGASVVVGFVYAFGGDYPGLSSQIQSARNQAPFETSGTGLAVSEEIPPTTRLFQNYPNPFSSTTNFRLDLQEPAEVKLTIYDVLGREVRVLVNRELEARTHILTYTNRQLSSGVYFVRLVTDEGIQTIPITLIK